MIMMTLNQSRYYYAKKMLANVLKIVNESKNPSDWILSEVANWRSKIDALEPLVLADEKAQKEFVEKYKNGIWATLNYKSEQE